MTFDEAEETIKSLTPLSCGIGLSPEVALEIIGKLRKEYEPDGGRRSDEKMC